MASQHLELTFKEQKLLDDNKQRAEDNRAAMPARKHRKETAADKTTTPTSPAATPKAPTQKEEPRGGTPDLHTPEEPAAQRRNKQQQLGIIGLQDITPIVYGEQFVLQSWTAHYNQPHFKLEQVPDGFGNQGEVLYRNREILDYVDVNTDSMYNSYTINAKSWQPALFFEKKGIRGYASNIDAYTVPNNIDFLNWTYRHKAVGETRNSIDQLYTYPDVPSSPPTIPFRLLDKRIASQHPDYKIVCCDGGYVYVSIVVREVTPSDDTYRNWPYKTYAIEDPLAFDGLYPFFGYRGDFGYFTALTRSITPASGVAGSTSPTYSDFDTGSFFTDYGHYWKINLRTAAVTYKQSTLTFGRDGSASSIHDGESTLSRFLDNLYASDPHSTHWQQYRNAFAESSANLANEYKLTYYKSFGANYYWVWPPGFVYYPASGLATIVTKTASSSTSRAYSKTIPPNLPSYTAAVAYLPPNYHPQTTTNKDFLDFGWKLDKFQTQFNFEPKYYFALAPLK